MRIDNSSNISRQINKRPNQQLEATIDMDLGLDEEGFRGSNPFGAKLYLTIFGLASCFIF